MTEIVDAPYRGRRVLRTTEPPSLEARIAAMTREAEAVAPKLSDEDLETWIQFHGRLLDTAVAEVRRRKERNT